MQRGILGGTFDPPHIAHLVAGEAAYRQLGLEVVSFIPAGAPWQKADQQVSHAEHRWEMTRRAIIDVGYFTADDREVRRDGWTYTVDTLDEFPDDAVTLVLGSDAAVGVPTWKDWSRIRSRARIAVMERLGTPRAEVEAAVDAPITWLDVPPLPISSTDLRDRAQRGESLRFLVPDGAWRYIQEHALYGAVPMASGAVDD